MVRTGEVVVADDIAPYARSSGVVAAGLRLVRMRSTIMVPIKIQSEITGAIVLRSRETGYFTEQDGLNLQTFAEQAGTALRNAQLFEQAQRNAEELEARSQATSDPIERALKNALLS